MPLHTIQVKAVLFDMDGTLIDSTPGVLKTWDLLASQYGFDGQAAAHASHGRRLHDTLKDYCNIQDEETLKAEIERFEEQVIVGGPVALPGAIQLINQIIEVHSIPNSSLSDPLSAPSSRSPHGWTIVTSATSFYAPRALARCNIPIPQSGLVCSNDVSRGKPYPDPYIVGANKCGVEPENCIVIEDAPSGIRAGHAAGAKTLGVCTSHTRDALLASGAVADYIVTDLTKVTARSVDGYIELTIDDDV